ARHLVCAIEALSEGKPYLACEAAQVVLQGFLDTSGRAMGLGRTQNLTTREREIIQLLAEGKSNKEVAEQLAISVRTAECHRRNIMHKLDLHSMSGLIRYAIRNNIVQVQ